MRIVPLLLLSLVMIAASCDDQGRSESAQPRRPAQDAPPATQAATPEERLPRVVFLGDSITAGLGVDADQAFPAVIDQSLAREGIEVDVVNAGVSGDTTAGGLARLDWLLRQRPDVLVVGLGGNDGLRGQDVSSSEENLRRIVKQARAAGADVLLLGMMMPPNYGPDYTERFSAIYPRLADEMNVRLVPFLLEGVGGEAGLNQPDGIHPTAEGHRLIAQNVLPHLRQMLRDGATTAPDGA